MNYHSIYTECDICCDKIDNLSEVCFCGEHTYCVKCFVDMTKGRNQEFTSMWGG